MANPQLNTMYIDMRFINTSGQSLDFISATHNAFAGSFPPRLSDSDLEVRVDAVQFQAAPHLRGDILIDYDVKKSIFEARFSYALNEHIIHFETCFSYAYEKRLYYQSPKINYYWDHSIKCTPSSNRRCSSSITRRTPNYPYSYKVDFLIE